MFDLKKGNIRLVPHQKDLPVQFEQEKKELKKILGNTAIDIRHVVSTAVPGMDGKPVIDIILGVKELQRSEEMEKLLQSVGYDFYHHTDSELLYVKGLEEELTHHLHIIKHKGKLWKKYILF